ENVFDIQQGVAILLAVKLPRINPHPSPLPKGEGAKVPSTLPKGEGAGKPSPFGRGLGEGSTVHHADVWGLRAQEYFYLLEHDVRQTQWQTLTRATPNYLFIPQDDRLRGEYEKYFSVTEIFPVNSVGVVTGQDAEAIKFSADEAE